MRKLMVPHVSHLYVFSKLHFLQTEHGKIDTYMAYHQCAYEYVFSYYCYYKSDNHSYSTHIGKTDLIDARSYIIYSGSANLQCYYL